MKKVLTIAGVTVLALSLTTGAAAIGNTSSTIGTTGPDSTNKVEVKHKDRREVRNNNNLDVDNKNDQYGRSGDAKVKRNTTGGSARTGNVMNDNLAVTDVTISNRSAAAAPASHGGSNTARITNTGPDSYNKVEVKSKSKVEVENNNNIDVYNKSEQTGKSGDATVTRNTTGGSATTGSVTNVNTTRTTINIQN